MNNKMKVNENEKQYDMCIIFSVEKDHQKLLDGCFIATPTQGISCIGENHIVEFGFEKDHMYKTGIFKGLVINHILGKDTASISMTMIDVVKDQSTPLGEK